MVADAELLARQKEESHVQVTAAQSEQEDRQHLGQEGEVRFDQEKHGKFRELDEVVARPPNGEIFGRVGDRKFGKKQAKVFGAIDAVQDGPWKHGDGYVVSISTKKQFRRLHYWGQCHRAPGVDDFSFEEYGDSVPMPEFYDD